MHAPKLVVRVCPNCDGFPVVAVSVGPRRSDGTLPTLPVVCLDCAGTGTGTRIKARPAPIPVTVGR